MTRVIIRVVAVTTLSAGFFATASQAQSQVQAPGIEAFRTQPRLMPYAPYESNNAAGVSNRAGSGDLIRAQAALDRGDFNRAVRLLRSRAFARNSEALYLSAVAENGLGRHSRARSSFAEALAYAPNHVGARLGLALTDLKLGRRADALAGLAVLEQRQQACASSCADAAALDMATQLIRHFLEEMPLV